MTNNELKIMVNNFEKCTGIHFRNKKLLCVALSHSSYAHENNTQSNERLEFLGDSVLGLVISERLYNDSTLAAEGKLSQMRSNIVSEKPLAELSKEKGYYKFLLLGVGERKAEPSRAMIADGMEAIIGAIFLDRGLKAAKKFILSNFNSLIKSAENSKQTNDSKSLLQEKFYKEGVNYKTIESGEAHNPMFNSTVFVGGRPVGNGIGKNKREAEKQAASDAIEYFESKQNKSKNITTKQLGNKGKKSEVQKN